jgi:hypothetical protein
MVEAWGAQNCRQVVSVSRTGPGDSPSPQDAADRGGPYAVAEFEQLALDSLVSPSGDSPGLGARSGRPQCPREVDGPDGVDRSISWRSGGDASAGSCQV